MSLPECPLCKKNTLRPVEYIAVHGLHYKVVCDSCHIQMCHPDFYGINQVEKFFEETCPDCGFEVQK